MQTVPAKDVQAFEDILLLGARQSASCFAEYVLRDEETGGRIAQEPLHREWHRMINENDRTLILSSVETGKTQQISIARTLYEVGKNPAARVAIFSNTHTQATKIVKTIARYIEGSEELRRVFPNLRPGEPWTSSQLFVQRATVSKDPSVQAFGVHGNVLGARIDLLIFDDVLDYENCRTPQLREELWEWIQATLIGRLTRRSKVIAVGTAFHPDDVLHRFEKLEAWTAKRFPILHPKTGQSQWPERWSLSRIERRRTELGPAEFARQMMCVARDDADSRFKQEYIDLALKRGRGRRAAYAVESLPPGCRTYTGVDLGVQRTRRSAMTVFFTILVHPNEDREVVNIESGKWSGPDIVGRIVDTHRRYMSIMIVENVAAQDFLVQFAQAGTAVPIRPFTTGRNKAHPEFGVESLATEMAGGKWIIPNDESGWVDPEVREWINEMLYYDPGAHTGDRLMGAYFAREGARMGMKTSKKVEFGRLSLTAR